MERYQNVMKNDDIFSDNNAFWLKNKVCNGCEGECRAKNKTLRARAAYENENLIDTKNQFKQLKEKLKTTAQKMEWN